MMKNQSGSAGLRVLSGLLWVGVAIGCGSTADTDTAASAGGSGGAGGNTASAGSGGTAGTAGAPCEPFTGRRWDSARSCVLAEEVRIGCAVGENAGDMAGCFAGPAPANIIVVTVSIPLGATEFEPGFRSCQDAGGTYPTERPDCE